ncbi:hypothetical protein AKJ61_01555 [candidate division MSBL1 archaeon SCGC-AAA259B11]|uniref:Uncharacterized protein n=1 Tax=candidate division MSBL1 archaeon SCGC-AAA259B11 TaxID=1698260 RepID=A0A133U771_9EURY|nr:hypothetical protein AKJ61_01555 [candidate division MSBL1 archaeon SCGC-AAA259B11]
MPEGSPGMNLLRRNPVRNIRPIGLFLSLLLIFSVLSVVPAAAGGNGNGSGRHIVVLEDGVCKEMKKHTLQKVYKSLRDGKHSVEIPEDVAEDARKATERMLELSG